MGAPMKYGIRAVTREPIAVQSRVSRTRAVSVRTRQKSPIARASHRARCSHRVVMPRTIRRAHRAVDGADPPARRVVALRGATATLAAADVDGGGTSRGG
jgi:hypothetical protein